MPYRLEQVQTSFLLRFLLSQTSEDSWSAYQPDLQGFGRYIPRLEAQPLHSRIDEIPIWPPAHSMSCVCMLRQAVPLTACESLALVGSTRDGARP